MSRHLALIVSSFHELLWQGAWLLALDGMYIIRIDNYILILVR